MDLAGPQGLAQELHPGLHHLVGLVEHGDVHRGQQLGHAAVAQGQIGEEEMVVDHHHVGGHGLAAGLHDMTGVVLAALAAQAVVAGGGDQGDDLGALVQTFEFADVAAAGGLSPGLDARQRPHRIAVRQSGALSGQHQPVPAQVAGPPLEQRHGHRQLQDVAQPGQIAEEELVLQALRGRADQGAAAGQQHRQQIGVGLAHAGARLRHQGLAPLDGLGHGLRQPVLRLARHEAVVGMGQWPFDGQSFADRRDQIGGRGCSGIGHPFRRVRGSSIASSWAIWSRSTRRCFLSRRRVSSSGPDRGSAPSMRLSSSACAMRNSINRRRGECRLSAGRRSASTVA